MPVDWAIVLFSAGVVVGLWGRPLVVKLFRAGMGWKKEVEALKKDAEK